MKIAILDTSGNVVFDRDKLGPWGNLLRILEENYYMQNISNLEELVEAQSIIFLNVSKKSLRYVKKRNKAAQLFLVVVEPEHVNDMPWKKKYQKRFKKIFALSEIWAKELGVEWSRYPQNYEPRGISLIENGNRKNRIVFAATNFYSFNKGNAYYLRRKILKEFLNNGIEIDVIGKNWDINRAREIINIGKSLLTSIFALKKMTIRFALLDSRIRNITKGYQKLKLEVLNQYRFALVVENSHDYVSEKIFDAILMGCIPIYVGNIDLNKELKSFCLNFGESEIGKGINEIKILMSENSTAYRKFNENDFQNMFKIDSYSSVSQLIAKSFFA